MYFFTGNNLFGQWMPHGKQVVDTVSYMPCDVLSQLNLNSKFNEKDVTLVHVGWSHNIFRTRNKYFILGDYKCKEKYVETIFIPQECGSISNVTIISNDYYLILYNRDTCDYWTVNIENENIKKFNLNVEVFKSEAKKLRTNEYISKCAVSNESLIFLTSNSSIYCGLVPSIIDTAHCKGEPTDIQCGNEHFMLMTSCGTLYTWGNGRRLQLGHGEVNILDIPTEVEALSGIKIVKIAAGGWHSLALSEFGDLYAWGWNDIGQLGIKENTQNTETLVSYSLPTLVDIYDENGEIIDVSIKGIACGAKHSALLLNDNSIWTSGSNKYGQLGFSREEYPSVCHFKKCCSYTLAEDLKCGQWSTVINVIKSCLLNIFYIIPYIVSVTNVTITM